MGVRAYDNYISTHFGLVHPDAEKEFELYCKYFRKNYLRHMPADKKANILDIGCGMGHFLYFLEKEGYINYSGIDISPENVKFCEEHRFHVELCDAVRFLEESNKPYDVIIMNDILEHFKKDEIMRLLGLINKNLAPQGKVIIKVPNAANPLMGGSSRYYDFTHEVSFTEESLSQVLRICSFRDVCIYHQDIYVFGPNPLNYIAKAAAWMSYKFYRLLFQLYGRKTTRIFTKDLIAVAQK